MERYVVRTDTLVSKPLSRKEAIERVKSYAKQGVSAYIVSEDEAQRLKNSEFNKPTWE
ncbi:hypothetical protein [Abyssisolibacter fermentans]|uniref:hypothetical protein n=1 Tax=Abyssisolibacter fermentans TaxID=1766203 RepID=UPI00192E6F84|nr:hypothetical protein [Abyssisolibacter fermentans]